MPRKKKEGKGANQGGEKGRGEGKKGIGNVFRGAESFVNQRATTWRNGVVS